MQDLVLANPDSVIAAPRLYLLLVALLGLILLARLTILRRHAHRTSKRTVIPGWQRYFYQSLGIDPSNNRKDLDTYSFSYYQLAIICGIFCLHPIFCASSPFAYLHLDQELEPLLFLELVLRMLGACVCVNMALFGAWNKRIRDKYFPLYLRILLIYCLPFLSSYDMLIAPHCTEAKIGFAFSICALGIFLRARTLLISLAIGLTCAYAVYAISTLSIGKTLVFPLYLDETMVYIILAVSLCLAMSWDQRLEIYRVYSISNSTLAKVANHHDRIREQIMQVIRVFERAVHVAADHVKHGNSMMKVYPGQRVMILTKEDSQIMCDSLEQVEHSLAEEVTEVQKLVTSWGRYSNRLNNATVYEIISEVAHDLWLNVDMDKDRDFYPVAPAKLVSKVMGLLFSYISRKVQRQASIKVRIALGGVLISYHDRHYISGQAPQAKVIDVLSADVLDLLLCQAIMASIGGAISHSTTDTGTVTLEIKLPGQQGDLTVSAAMPQAIR